MSQEALLQRVDPNDLATVRDWLDAAAPELRNLLVKRCGKDTPVHIDPAQSVRLEEVLHRSTVTACPFHNEPTGLRGLVLLETSLVCAVVGRFLGDSSDEPPIERPLTRIDLRMGQRLCEDVIRALQSSCAMEDVPVLRPGRISANPRTVQALPQARNVIDASFVIGEPDMPLGRIWVVLPPQGAGILWPQRHPRPNVRTHPAMGMQRVMPLPLPVVAELARATIPLARLQKLQVGDMLELGPMHNVTLRVGERPTMLAEPGESDGVRSVRIRRRLAELG
jgi:flagellar motor switch protein FliM